jgi:hypothetical protein
MIRIRTQVEWRSIDIQNERLHDWELLARGYDLSGPRAREVLASMGGNLEAACLALDPDEAA